MFDDDDRWMPSTLQETPAANELFGSANAFGNRNGLSNDMVGLFLMGVMAVSFKFVYPNLPLTDLLVDFNFWAKLCGRFLSPGDGVNGINGPSGGILLRLFE